MEKRKKIAVLIDYDNFNQEKYLPILFEELNEIGDVLLKYAFYSNLSDGTVKDKFIRHGIEPQSQIAYSSGKNAVDIRITIEAMSLLGKDYIDCICLASNDSDFTPLVYQLQKSNRFVVGAGDNHAKETYKNAFNSFISVEKMIKPVKVLDKKEAVKNKALDHLVQVINNIINSNHDEFGFADFSYVILTLKNQMKDFNPKNYGAKNSQVLPFFQKFLKAYYELKKDGTIYNVRRVKQI